jgi:hypothetical protein
MATKENKKIGNFKPLVLSEFRAAVTNVAMTQPLDTMPLM